MIRYFECIFFIFEVFIFITAEALIGKKVSRANPLEFPFIVSLGLKQPNQWMKRYQLCTGSLITKEHVLTAAHCIIDISKNEIDVVVGTEDLRTVDITYEVDWWITYDDWAQRLRIPIEFPSNDIAIIKLVSMVNREGIVPVKLTHLNNKQLHRTKAVIAGWGVNNENQLSDVLLKANVTILADEKCEQQLKLVSNLLVRVYKNYMCTSATPYVLSECGDSGGPLLGQDNILLGIMRGSCPKTYWGDFSPEFLKQYQVNLHPSVYYYRDFIKDVANIV